MGIGIVVNPKKMSYDLSFYKQNNSNLSDDKITDYLTANLVPAHENGNKWIFENTETDVYCSFDQNEDEDRENLDDEMYESFKDFYNTHFPLT